MRKPAQKAGLSLSPARVNAKKEFTVSDFDNETITILKSEQGVHDTEMTVNIRHIESKRIDIERSSQGFGQILLRRACTSLILSHADIGGLLRKADQCTKMFLCHAPQVADIHIDFVPFTTGSKRGLDTRVSLKQTLAAQGCRGGTRGATDWNQWELSEKKELAISMFRYGFEWEQKGTLEEHLSVIDYKKHERTKELAAVEEKLADRSAEFNTLAKRINNLEDGEQSYQDM